MKINVEIEIDWIKEDNSIDEEIKNEIISSVSDQIKKCVMAKVDKELFDKVNKKTDEFINVMLNNFMDREIQQYDEYGDKTKKFNSLQELLKKKFDLFMMQDVDKDGHVTSSSCYASKRIDFILNGRLKAFANEFTSNMISRVHEEIKTAVNEQMKEKITNDVFEILGIAEIIDDSIKTRIS